MKVAPALVEKSWHVADKVILTNPHFIIMKGYSWSNSKRPNLYDKTLQKVWTKKTGKSGGIGSFELGNLTRGKEDETSYKMGREALEKLKWLEEAKLGERQNCKNV